MTVKNRVSLRIAATSGVGVAALAVVLLVAGAARSSNTPAVTSGAPPPEVTVAPVIHRPVREWQEFTGRMQAVNTVEVRPRVSGYVDRVAFKDGERVRKGQLLFQIDPRPFQSEVDRLVAERSRSLSDLELARANRSRAERLIGAHAISQEEYERLLAAEHSSEGAVASLDASLQEARLNREFTEVRAPIDGHVSRAIVTAGNLVSSANVLTTLVSDDPVYVYFDADEQAYLRYSKAKHSERRGSAEAAGVYIGLADESGYPHAATLDFIDNQVNAATGTIRARAALANPDGRYTPGLFARVRLVAGEARDSVLIEDKAVGTDLSRKFVLTLAAGNRVEYRLVELGREINGLRIVEKGLVPGDVVLVNGMQHVQPGQAVSPTQAEMTGSLTGLAQVMPDPLAGHSLPRVTRAAPLARGPG